MTELTSQTYRYHEPLPPGARRNLARAQKCVRCRRGGWRCLNRTLRVLNFAHECEQEAKRQGSFMIARLSRALFDLVRHSREWDDHHVAVINTLCESIKHLAAKPAGPPQTTTQHTEDLLEDVTAWVGWLEDICDELKRRPASHECLRRPERRPERRLVASRCRT